jgi:hypothetical protein
MSAIESHCATTGLHLGAPACVRDTYALLCRELTRKQGMIEDLHELANANFGMTPEDCDTLVVTVRDRDAIKQGLAALETLFS